MGINIWVSRFDESGNKVDLPTFKMVPRHGDLSLIPLNNSPIESTFFVQELSDKSSHSDNLKSTKIVFPSQDSPIDEITDDKTESNNTAEVIVDTVMPVDDKAVKFTVRIFSLDDGYTLIDVCHHKLGHQSAHEHLGASILKSISISKQLEVIHFQWPFADNPRIDSRKSAALSASRSFFSTLQNRIGITSLILLGDAADYFSSNDIPKRILQFSLTDILNNQIEKRYVWEQIKQWKSS
jgi:hypothetical protein